VLQGSKLNRFLNKEDPKNSWAVVTGASDGIGKEFALQLAQRGWNIVLVSRPSSRLDEATKEIGAVGTKALSFGINLSTATKEDYKKLGELLVGLDIGVLVNNAAVGHELPEKFLDVDEAKLDDFINVNVNASTRILRLVLPTMVAQHRGLIINVSSLAGALPVPIPLYSLYSASKKYLGFLSYGLSVEYKSEGIHVECLTPSMIKTKMSKITKTSLNRPLPSTFVRAALSHVGNKIQHTGYIWHEWYLYSFLVIESILPGNMFINMVYKSLQGNRAKALARAGLTMPQKKND